MNKNAKILIIPDCHGHDTFKQSLKNNNIDKYDLVIFLGDYCDSFTLDNITIKNNLLDIIQLKKDYPDKVVLLWGNHEMHYYLGRSFKCTGFRSEAYFDLNEIFVKNSDLFQTAFQLDTKDGDKYLFSHAGVEQGWYDEHIKEHFTYDMAFTLNMLFEQNYKPIFDVGRGRGGFKRVGGVLWADYHELYQSPIKGYNQIVGHTYLKDGFRLMKWDDGRFVHFIDGPPYYLEMEIENVISWELFNDQEIQD